jgi:diacylglycerol kinase (ATP)
MRAALVTNPRAGKGRGLRAAAQAEAVLRGADWQIEPRLTEGPGDGIRLARQAAHDGYDAVLACGGDGTLSEVLNGLRGTGIPAGVIPAGTGNDFSRTAGISRDPAQAARQLLTAEVAAVDMLAVNDGARWAVNVIGVGFDARVARRINRRRRLTAGLSTYLTAVTQELIVYRPDSLSVEVDGTRWEGAALLVAIANARSYGAGMCIAPMAEIDDGLLDVIVVAHLGRLAFLRSFPQVLRGTHLGHPAVRTWRGREVKVTAPTGPVPVLVDGDVQCETPLSVRVVPGAARMLLPREGRYGRAGS